MAAKGMAIATGSEQSTFIRWNGFQGEHAASSNSIRRDAGLLDDLCPKRNIRFDDVGELRLRGALRLTSGDVELLAYVDCRKRGFQRLADAIDNRLGCPRWHDDPKPRRHLCFGVALLRHGRHVREIFRAAVVDRGD